MTPRQQLIKVVADYITCHNFKAFLLQEGCPDDETKAEQMRLAENGITLQIQPINAIIDKIRINEIVEGCATTLGNDVEKYYLNQTDTAYERMVTAIFKQVSLQLQERINQYKSVDRYKPQNKEENDVIIAVSQHQTYQSMSYPPDALKISQDESTVLRYCYNPQSDLAGYYTRSSLSVNAVKALIKRRVLEIDRHDHRILSNIPDGVLVQRSYNFKKYQKTNI